MFHDGVQDSLTGGDAAGDADRDWFFAVGDNITNLHQPLPEQVH